MKLGTQYQITSFGVNEDEDLFTNSYDGDVVVVVNETSDDRRLVESLSTENRFYIFQEDVNKGWIIEAKS